MKLVISDAHTGHMLRFVMRERGPVATIAPADIVAPDGGAGEELELVRAQETELPRALKWQVLRSDEEYDGTTVEATRGTGDAARVTAEAFPLAVPIEEAGRRCRRALSEAWVGRETATFALPPSRLALDPGDVVQLAYDGRLVDYRIMSIIEAGSRRFEAMRHDRSLADLAPAPPRGTRLPRPAVFGAPAVALLDLPQLRPDHPAHQPLVAVHARPWPGEIAIWRGTDGDGGTEGLEFVTGLDERAQLGSLVSDLHAGPVARLDLGNVAIVEFLSGTLESVTNMALGEFQREVQHR